MNIDEWLFRLADNKECEPEINTDGSITCKKCFNTSCEYFDEFHSEAKNV